MEQILLPIYCPFCRNKKLVKSYETGTDYDVVGNTYRCKHCKRGFGFLLEKSDDWEEDKLK